MSSFFESIGTRGAARFPSQTPAGGSVSGNLMFGCARRAFNGDAGPVMSPFRMVNEGTLVRTYGISRRNRPVSDLVPSDIPFPFAGVSRGSRPAIPYPRSLRADARRSLPALSDLKPRFTFSPRSDAPRIRGLGIRARKNPPTPGGF